MKGVRAGFRLVAVLGALVATLDPAPSEADGDIVYSARYYMPGTQPSHHHIWRINPDGGPARAARRQLDGWTGPDVPARQTWQGGRWSPPLYGRDLAWSPDGRRFLTGEGRGMAGLAGVGYVRTSSLFLASLRDASMQPVVEGLVEVGGFDWRQ